MTIGENIKLLREEHGMTQADLAKIVGATDRAVSTWEIGTATPRMGKIEKMAQYFRVPKSEIIGDTEEQQQRRLLAYYEQFKPLIDLANRLDKTDLARLEERAEMMLEQEKYQ